MGQMGTRYCLSVIASISICLFSGTEHARAQALRRRPESAAHHGNRDKARRQTRPRPARDPQGSRRYRPSWSIRRRRCPAATSKPTRCRPAVTTIDANQIKQTGSLNISDALVKYVPGISINEVAGNPFQPDVQFRGFVASPVSGTPQGLAVYQNGVRINEAFGDTVNWDLIPTAAIKSVDLVTNNPAFGLNALGGAVDIQMKDGFNYHGAEIDTMGGSFGRIQSSAAMGQADRQFRGLRRARRRARRRISQFLDIEHPPLLWRRRRTRTTQPNFTSTWASPTTISAPPRPRRSNCCSNIGAPTYTTPQTSTNKVGYVNLTGKVEVSPTWTIDGIAHVRIFNQKTQDGNPTDTQPCDADPTLLCFGDGATPANGLNGAQLANPFDPSAVLGENDRTTTQIDDDGRLAAGDQYRPVVRAQQSFRGRSQLRLQRHAFHGQRGTGHDRPRLCRQRLRHFPRPVRQSGFGSARSSLRTTNQYTGLYALDTFDVTNAFSITGGGRFNVANIDLQDQLGTALNGSDTYTRFNPIIGGTYKITSGIDGLCRLFRSQPRADPAGTRLRRSGPPLHHRRVPGFRSAAASRSCPTPWKPACAAPRISSFGTLDWKLGAFRADNTDDILAIPSHDLQGFGYFQNVGSTRRQGIEAEVSAQVRTRCSSTPAIPSSTRASWMRCSSAPTARLPTPTAISRSCPATRSRRFRATGSRPAFDYAVTDAFKVGGDALFVSSQYFVGDESNQFPQLPSYAVFNLHASYQINKKFQIYARADNIFDNRYATYGTFFDTSAAAQFRQWRRAVHRPAFAQPGAAARALCRHEGHVLKLRRPRRQAAGPAAARQKAARRIVGEDGSEQKHGGVAEPRPPAKPRRSARRSAKRMSSVAWVKGLSSQI